MNIVFFGTPAFAVPALDEIVSNGFQVVAVVTAPDKPAGRGLNLIQSAVKHYAVDHAIPVLQPVNLSDPLFLQQLRELQVDLQVVVAFRFLPEKVWSLPPLGTFNLHASLLPQYRGAAPINHAIINGESITGLTTFFLDHQIDTGRILFQKQLTIDPDDNAGSLHDKLMKEGAGLVVETLKAIETGSVSSTDQSFLVSGDMELKKAPKLNREMAHIEWDLPAVPIHNLVRGLSPYPAAFGYLHINENNRILLKVLKTRVSDEQMPGVPGQVLTDFKRFFRICTRNGWIDLLQVQPEGRKLLLISEFLNGFVQQYAKNQQIQSLTMR